MTIYRGDFEHQFRGAFDYFEKDDGLPKGFTFFILFLFHVFFNLYVIEKISF